MGEICSGLINRDDRPWSGTSPDLQVTKWMQTFTEETFFWPICQRQSNCLGTFRSTNVSRIRYKKMHMCNEYLETFWKLSVVLDI